MLYNKNSVRKTNDKKILHKVGKQWKVISVALLMAIGGGAAVAATNNTSANADANNANVTAATSAEANSLEAMDNYANPYAKPASKSAASSASAKAPSFENINYAPSARVDGNNASAASEKNNENFDKANMSYYGPIVKAYVNSMNARFPEARSLATSYSAASDNAANDQSLSGSYAATAKNSETANVINSMAARDGVTASYFTDSVAYNVLGNNGDAQTNGYVHDVSDAANTMNQESAVASAAALISAVSNNSELKASYKANYELLSASAQADSDYAADEGNVAKNLQNASATNVAALSNAQSALASYYVADQVASINSGIDATFVNSFASAGGFSYTSSVVSSAVSAMANNFNSSNDSVTSYSNNSSNNYSMKATGLSGVDNTQAYYDNNDTQLVFNANNQKSNANKYISIELNGSANSTAALYQVVSDTAAQSAYNASASALNSAIASAKGAISGYAAQVSSANSAAQSASAKYVASNDAKNSAKFLGTDPTIAGMFGSSVPVSVTSYYYNPLVASEANSAATDALLNGLNNLTNGDLDAPATPYASAVNAIKGAMNELASNNPEAFSAAMSYANQSVSGGTTRAASLFSEGTSALSLAESYAKTGKALPSVNVSLGNNKINLASLSNPTDLINTTFNLVNKKVASLTSSATGHAESFAPATISSVENSASSTVKSLSNANLLFSNSASGNKPATAGFLNKLTNAFKSNGNSAASDANSVIASANKSANNSSYAVSASVSYGKSYVTSGLLNANSYQNAMPDFDAALQATNASAQVSLLASDANSAATNYSNESSASASYAKSADQDVTIASQFANYYGSKASSDANIAKAAKNSLDNFYMTHANNEGEFNTASATYTSASNAEPNDADLAHAFGINVLNHSPKYIVLDHNAMLHSDPNYTKSNGVESVKAGDTFTVKGVGFDKVGNIRYEVSAKNGKPAFVTANDYYVENAYLEPGETYDVTLSHAAREHTDVNYGKGKAVKTAAKGTTFKDVTAVRADGNYEGITRLQLANGNYITANKYYLTDVSTVANNSNNGSNVQYGRVTF